MVQRLRYNVTGQTLRHVPATRQATIAWSLEDLRYDVDNASRVLDSGTAAVDTATEALTSALGPGEANPRLGTVASTAGFVAGESYDLVAASGVREVVEVEGLTSNTSVLLKHPPSIRYASGSTIRGLAHTTAAIDSSVLQDEQRVIGDWPMRVVWVYADGYRYQEQVRLVRDDQTDLFVAAILADVRDLFPDLDTRLAHHNRDTLTPHVRATIRRIRADALERKIVIEEWLSGEQGHWAAVWRTLLHLAQLGNVPGTTDPREWVAYCKAEYEARWLGLTIGEPGKETVQIEPTSGTAPESHDTTYRSVIASL